MHALPNLLMSKRCLHVFHRSIIQSKCNSCLAHCNTLFQLNSSPQLRLFSSQLPVRFAQFQTTASIGTGSLPVFLQFARTQLRNATHRDLLRFRYSSSRRPPRRPNWLDSINGNVIFVAILAINGGVFLLWQSAKSTYQTTRDPTLWIFLRDDCVILGRVLAALPTIEAARFASIPSMAGYQPDVYASISITLTVATIALCCRLAARRMTKQKYWYDDCFAVVAFMSAVVYCAVILNSTVKYGLGTDIDCDTDPERAQYETEMARLNMWIGSLSYATSIAASKISFLTFYWRIFQFTAIRIPIQVLLVVTVLWIIIRTCLTILQCLPVSYIWDKNVDGSCAINQSMFFFSSVLVHCILDMIILILPIFPIFKMHLTRSKKLGVVGLFSSGIVVCVASVFVLIESITISETDPDEIPPEAARNWYWAAVEVNMAIFSGSLPMLRPVVLKIFPSCMLGSDDFRSYDNVSAIRLSRTEGTERTKRRTVTLPSGFRKNSKGLHEQSTFLAQRDSPAQQQTATFGDAAHNFHDPWRIPEDEPATPNTQTSRDRSLAEHDVVTTRQDV